MDLIPPIEQRIYCVGRLDVDSTGIIILTNDGELTNRLTHPAHEVPKTYVVEVDGRLSEDDVAKLKRGIYLGGKRTRSAGLKILHRGHKRSMLQITLREGRNRHVRRVLARLGHKVRKLKRVGIGPITDRGLKVGNARKLRAAEVDRLLLSGR